MGGGTVPLALAVAVSRAGGLGMLNSRDVTPLAERLDALDDSQAGPYGVNFSLHGVDEQVDRAQVELAASRARLIEFFWAAPRADWVAWAHAGGALACWQVGSVEEARQAVGAGCDLVVVQGVEAGGHVRGSVAMLPLLVETLDAVDVPVLAAGGIATGRSLAAVLAAGGSGVRVGTRFLVTAESGAHPTYVRALLAAEAADRTVLTGAYSVGWPDAPHRVLAAGVDAATETDQDPVATLHGRPVARWSAQSPSREVEGMVEAMALYAGQGVGRVTGVLPAAEVVARMVADATDLLASAAAAVEQPGSEV
jgi:NAD(P)H-dependent flavin oxidoreductase YrpB (nitropropane dioxygenase family)